MFTASAILGQTQLSLLNPKPQLSKNKVHLILQPKQTVLFPFTRWQHVYYILERRTMLRYDGRVYTSVTPVCTNQARDMLTRPSWPTC